MNYPTCTNKSSSLLRWSPLLALIALTACNREEVRSYSVGKESSSVPAASAMPSSMGGALPAGHPDMGGAVLPSVTWKTPADWKELPPTQIRVGSFEVKAADGKQAEVTVIPLSEPAGGDFENVNLWRRQAGLAPVTEEEMKKLAAHMDIPAGHADMYEQIGKNVPDGKGILGVILHREGRVWFFKMTGDPDLVVAQKPTFVEFLKSVQFGAPQTAPQTAAIPAGHPPVGGAGMTAAQSDPMAPAPTTGPISRAGQPTWQIPAGWQEVSGGDFLVGKFLINGDAGTQAAVNVSSSVGDGGGLLANLNRWRVQQLQLPAATDADVGKMTTQIDVTGGKGTFVDLTGTDARTSQPTRMLAVMVQQSGKAWFYKLMGDPKIVEAQKDAFTKFVQGVKY